LRLLERSLAVLGFIPGAGVVRHFDPLQTDGHWWGVGADPAVLTMVVFSAVFGKLAKLPSDGIAPYALSGI
jgi:hypothetical protein